MKPNKFAISLLAGMTLLSTNVISEEKSKHKGKSKPQKMTEVIEECVVDRETGRESCHVVSSTPVTTSTEQTTPVKTVEMPSELVKETTTECIGDVCTTTVVEHKEHKQVDAPETPKQAALVQDTQSSDRAMPVSNSTTKLSPDTSEQRDFTVASANQNVQSDSRVALVIGNSTYAKVTPLSNPTHDADDMAAQLRKIGFDVVKYNNVKIQQIGTVLSEFRSKLKPGSAALVFYAGHGMQIKGENYFPVIDADIHTEEDVPNQSISLRQITGILEDSKTRLNLVFLDACRNNPYTRGFRSVEGGLARVTAPSGTLISYATRPGSVAADGDGRNGLYTSKLLRHMTSQREIELTLKDVLSEVKTSSKGKQEPWIEGAIEGNFCFGGCVGGSVPAPVSESIQQVEQPETPTTQQAQPASCHDCPEMVTIPEGRFMMGSSTSGPKDEAPVHDVSVKKFALGKYEVTKQQFANFVNETGYDAGNSCHIHSAGKFGQKSGYNWNNPSFNQGMDHPVTCVNFRDSQAYVNWLNQKTGGHYRLPTEAEWEYAARAGVKEETYWGTNEMSACGYANVADQAEKQLYPNARLFNCRDDFVYTASIGHFSSNSFGLFDMLGNVYEWTCSAYTENGYNGNEQVCPMNSDASVRVLRGGYWNTKPEYTRFSDRSGYAVSDRTYYIGFRVAQDI